VRKLAEISINDWNQTLQGSLIALAPPDQQLGQVLATGLTFDRHGKRGEQPYG